MADLLEIGAVLFGPVSHGESIYLDDMCMGDE
jgi:hypothetical protein